MKLYLEKRGCDFWKDDDRAKESDLENYRLFLEFIAKDGRRICGDIVQGDIRQPFTNNCGHVDYKTISNNGLYNHLQYENHTGCYCYSIDADFTPHYTQSDALKLINTASAVQYESVEIVSELPAAAHDYPENVLSLERAYLEKEHAALVDETTQKIKDNYAAWIGGLRWSFHDMTAEEYKRMTLLAFDLMVEKYGVIEQKPENKIIVGAIAAHNMTKHFFEEQSHVDPYADTDFLGELEKRSPFYVGRYIHEMTPEEFAASVEE